MHQLLGFMNLTKTLAVPNLHFISHIPQSVSGEQLVNQFYRCIPDQTWLFKYGRVPMNLIMGEWVWQVWESATVMAPFCSQPFVAFIRRPSSRGTLQT